MINLYNISIATTEGIQTTLEPYRGQVMLIVNVASKCGFTPTYNILQQLYEEYKDQGFVVLGFPCNQFANQEPGDAKTIQAFCTNEYNISFPLFSKIKVNGRNTHPLYRQLKQAKPGILNQRFIPWNFTKFLIDRNGDVIQRFSPLVKDKSVLTAAIEKLL